MKHLKLLVSVILLFINAHYSKAKTGENKQTNKKKPKKNRTRNEVNCSHPPSVLTLNGISINNVINRMPFL